MMVRAVMLGPRNCEAVVGQQWRWVRDRARAWGVPVLRVGVKSQIDAELFLAALARVAEPEQPVDTDEQVEAACARELGLQRVAR